MGVIGYQRRRTDLLLVGCAAAALCSAPTFAQTTPELAKDLERLRQELLVQSAQIQAQEATIQNQLRQIRALQSRLDSELDLAELRGRGLAQTETTGQASPPAGPSVTGPIPDAPVGAAPPGADPVRRAQVAAMPEDQSVLTPAGTFVLDPQVEYVNASANRLVFRGIELIPGIQIGLIEASDVDRSTLIGTTALRYGVTKRLEAEVRVPLLHRDDRIEVVQQRDEGIVRTIELEETQIGDVEFGLRYQLNQVRPLKPIWIAQLRVKSDTGRGPFDIGIDEFGIATGLATGSGFWAVQPGISFLLPSDPVVIYGGLNYLWHIERDVDRTIGGAFVGRVDPGDAIAANIGFGFALNPRFSYSLGYKHNYIIPTETEIGATVQKSNELQVGQLTLGLSYRFAERQTVNLGFNFGVTEDAPDVSISLRVPITFGAPWK